MSESVPGTNRDLVLPVALTALVALVAFTIGAVGLVVAVTDDDGSGSGGDVALAAGAPSGAVTLTEFAISGDLEVPAGPVVLQATNAGTAVHNLALRDGPTTPDIDPGGTASLDLGELTPGTYELFCSIPGHEAAGMVADLVVTEGGTATAAGADEGHDPETDGAALDAAMMESILEFPAETEGVGNEPLEPRVLPDGTLEFDLTVEITPWEVEPGRIVDAWSYNGQVPGPLIQVDVGDTVRVNVENRLPLGTDVHWHGIDTPFAMDGVAPITQDLIESGGTFVYEFTTRRTHVGMYHAHTHGQMAVPNGLFGVFQVGDVELPRGRTISGVEIPADLEVAQEHPMVLNDAGVIGYSLNGKSFPATAPFVVDSGDWIVVHYFNEGLQIHPMHLHQFDQLVYAKDGIALDQPYWADTVNIAPGERYSVLVRPDEAGTWVFHCHILTHVEREEGMFGMVTAIVVE